MHQCVYKRTRKGVPRKKLIACDTEYTQDNELLVVAVSDDTFTLGIDLRTDSLDMLRDVLCNAETVVFHNAPVDIAILTRYNLAQEKWAEGKGVGDTYVIAKLVNENLLSYSLEQLVTTFIDNAPLYKEETKALIATPECISPKLLVKRCSLDASLTYQLYATLLEHTLPPQKLMNMHHKLIMTLSRMSLAGMKVDKKKLSTLRAEKEARVAELTVQLRGIALKCGVEAYETTKDAQTRKILFGHYKLKPIRLTTKGKLPSVDSDTLKLYEENKFAALLLECKQLKKQLSTWFGGANRKTDKPSLVERIDSAGIIHPKFWYIGAVTGRRSSSQPNFQNFPPEAKKIFRSRFPRGKIFGADYKSLEMRLGAWQYQDEKLKAYFGPGGPGYIGVGKDLFGTEVKKGTKDYTTTKSTVLGASYCLGWFNLARRLWYKQKVHLHQDYEKHEQETEKVLDKYLHMYPGLLRYRRQRYAEVLRTQKAIIPGGRIRHLPHYGHSDEKLLARRQRQGVNAPIQGIASEVMALALVCIERKLCELYGLTVYDYYDLLLSKEMQKHPEKMPCSCLVSEVHDCAVVDLKPGNISRDCKAIIEVMENEVPELLRILIPDFDVILSVDPTLNTSWFHKDS